MENKELQKILKKQRLQQLQFNLAKNIILVIINFLIIPGIIKLIVWPFSYTITYFQIILVVIITSAIKSLINADIEK